MSILMTRRPGFRILPHSKKYSPKQKKFNYSDESTYYVLEQAIADMAAITNSNSSDVIEGILTEHLMPQESRAKTYFARVLLNACDNPLDEYSAMSLQKALSSIAEEESAGINLQSVHGGEGEEFFIFADKMLRRNQSTIRKWLSKSEQSQLDYMEATACISSLEAELKRISNESKDITEVCNLTQGYLLMRQIRDKFSLNSDLQLSSVTLAIINNWKYLGHLSTTWRCLSSILSIINEWDEQAEDRYEFKNVCSSVFTKWEAKETFNNQQKQQDKAIESLNVFKMTDGALLVAPLTWIAINPEIAKSARYAGAISVKNGAEYQAPVFVFFTLNKPVTKLSNKEEEEILSQAEIVWPTFAKIRQNQVQPRMRKDGGYANAEEVANSPVIGIFPIPEHDEFISSLKYCGAEIIRNKKGE